MESSGMRPGAVPSRSSARVAGATSAVPQTSASGRRQATLAAFSRRVLSVSNVEELLAAATRAMSHALHTEYVAAFEYDPRADVLRLRAGGGWREGLVGQAALHTGTEFHEGYTLDRPDPVVVADHNSEIRFAASPLLVEHGVLSSVCTAVRPSRRPFGLLGAYALRARVFSHEDAQFLQVVAHVTGTVLARLRAESALVRVQAHDAALFEARSRAAETPTPAAVADADTEKAPTDTTDAAAAAAPQRASTSTPPAATGPATSAHRRRLEAAKRVAELAASTEELDATLQLVVQEISAASGYPMTAIELWDAAREVVVLGAATVAPGRERPARVEKPLQQTLAGAVIERGKALVEHVDGTSDERRDALQRIGATTFVCLPLRARGQIVGALSLAHRRTTYCDHEFMTWLAGLGQSVALLLATRRDEQTLRSERDHALEAQLRAESARQALEKTLSQRDAEGPEHISAARTDARAGERIALARQLDDRLRNVLLGLEVSLHSKAQNRDDLATDLRTVNVAVATLREIVEELRNSIPDAANPSNVEPQDNA